MTSSREHPPIAEAYRGVRAVVLGASGFIGCWVARGLCEHGAIVHAVVRDRAAAAKRFAEYRVIADTIEADLTQPGALQAILRDARPSIVINLAGYGVDRTERDEHTLESLNAHLVAALTEAVGQLRADAWRGQRLVHVGSAQEYGRAAGDLDEDRTEEPTTAYGRSKLSGTEHVRRSGAEQALRAVTARLFTVYGPGEHAGRLLPALIDGVRAGRPVALTTGAQQRDFTYVEDVAEGLLRLGICTAPAGAVVNLATGRLSSVRAFAETAARVLGLASTDLRFGAIPTRADEMFHGPVIIERLRDLTGWEPPTGLAEGIRRTWAFPHDRQHSHV